MYSVRLQYRMDDTLLTDIFRCEFAYQVNDKIMDLLEHDVIIEALRMVRVHG